MRAGFLARGEDGSRTYDEFLGPGLANTCLNVKDCLNIKNLDYAFNTCYTCSSLEA